MEGLEPPRYPDASRPARSLRPTFGFSAAHLGTALLPACPFVIALIQTQICQHFTLRCVRGGSP